MFENWRIVAKNTPRTPTPAQPPLVITAEERRALPEAPTFFMTGDSAAIVRKNRRRPE